MKRQALDNAAKDYWTAYFGEYGKAWVREIPRRIKAAAHKKTAQLDEPSVVPAGYTITTDGGLDLEGAIRDASGTRLFSASFDADGNVKDFRTFGDK